MLRQEGDDCANVEFRGGPIGLESRSTGQRCAGAALTFGLFGCGCACLYSRACLSARRAGKNRPAQTSGAAHHCKPESPLSFTTREGTKFESSNAGKDNSPVQEEKSATLYPRRGPLSKKNFRISKGGIRVLCKSIESGSIGVETINDNPTLILIRFYAFSVPQCPCGSNKETEAVIAGRYLFAR